jgi:hypothetical protein
MTFSGRLNWRFKCKCNIIRRIIGDWISGTNFLYKEIIICGTKIKIFIWWSYHFIIILGTNYITYQIWMAYIKESHSFVRSKVIYRKVGIRCGIYSSFAQNIELKRIALSPFNIINIIPMIKNKQFCYFVYFRKFWTNSKYPYPRFTACCKNKRKSSIPFKLIYCHLKSTHFPHCLWLFLLVII